MDFIKTFQEAIKIPTWWPSGAQKGDAAAEANLLRFQAFLTERFPAFHKTAERWVLSPYAVVYRLAGRGSEKARHGSANAPDTASTSDAVLLLAHYDVVPAETEKWSVSPFGAEIKGSESGNFIYGRGTLDMKATLVSIMEAAESLCSQGWKPAHDIWIAFGGDEERAGVLGAMETVRWFEKQGQRFAWVLDEGTPIAENQIKGVDTPLALVSIEEKGFLSLTLSVKQEPGHASRPPKVQAAAVLGQALCRIAKKPFPFRLSRTIEMFFRQVSQYMPGIQGFVMRHARSLGGLFFKLAANNPAIESMVRTTVAMTQLEGSAADNVMPSEVKAVINLRMLCPWTVETAKGFIEKAINDKRVTVSVYEMATDPIAASTAYEQYGWPSIQAAMNQAWPGIPLLPFLMVATTDSRHYQKIASAIFRFSPFKLTPEELGTIHGHDERISEENLRRGLSFYTSLLRSL